jgi:hypothetical protein
MGTEAWVSMPHTPAEACLLPRRGAYRPGLMSRLPVIPRRALLQANTEAFDIWLAVGPVCRGPIVGPKSEACFTMALDLRLAAVKCPRLAIPGVA